jgi:hypothetical protein
MLEQQSKAKWRFNLKFALALAGSRKWTTIVLVNIAAAPAPLAPWFSFRRDIITS